MEDLSNARAVEDSQSAMQLKDFHVIILTSFLVCAFIHHVASPLLFKRFNSAYRALSKCKQMEWDSRTHVQWINFLWFAILPDEIVLEVPGRSCNSFAKAADLCIPSTRESCWSAQKP
ncbi:unnamed protein product [Mesocestoides corti]|uniref:DUF4408 domain-containing protein n=1 Tax=Mesocestoides corti TaxID=53468 RepID=A0A0R3UC76_MESCO|nr:unnamed protein product [Mesocestoides corti]